LPPVTPQFPKTAVPSQKPAVAFRPATVSLRKAAIHLPKVTAPFGKVTVHGRKVAITLRKVAARGRKVTVHLPKVAVTFRPGTAPFPFFSQKTAFFAQIRGLLPKTTIFSDFTANQPSGRRSP